MSEVGKIDKRRNDEGWFRMFGYAKKYFETYGNLEMSSRFTVTAEDGEIIKLGQWISIQRSILRKNPGSERYELLKGIGMTFEKKLYSEEWYEMFLLAKQFYKMNGHLDVPNNFITTNDYIQKGINLGKWIRFQRLSHNPRSPISFLLDCIGMIWDIQPNKYDVVSLCHELGINTEQNVSVLTHKSISEIRVKVAFVLKSLGVDIVDEFGNLHKIFSMLDDDMYSCFGITLEDLTKEYRDIKSEELIVLYNYFKLKKENESCDQYSDLGIRKKN